MRIGMIGMSGHGRGALNAMSSRPEAKLVAVAPGHESEKVETLRGHREFTGSTKEFASPQALLDEANLDAVIIDTPYGLHARFAAEAGKAGVAVYCEKPLATSLVDLDMLAQAFSQSGASLVGMYELRAHPVVATAARLVREGHIGRPLLAFGQKSYKFNPATRPVWYGDRQLYGGTIPWVAVHAIDWIRFIAGLEFGRVSASAIAVGDGHFSSVESAGAIHLEFRGGGSAAVTFDYLRPLEANSHGDDRFRIAGSEGVLVGCLHCNELELLQKGVGVLKPELDSPAPLFVQFLDGIAGKAPMPMTCADALTSTRVALLAKEAAEQGRCLFVPE